MPKPPMFYIDPHNPSRICRDGEPSMTFPKSPDELIEHRLDLLNQGVLYEGERALNAELLEALQELCKVTDGFEQRTPEQLPKGSISWANRRAHSVIAKAERRLKP